jgi:hypothetical protein
LLDITSLTASTTYYFTVTSQDAAGNSTTGNALWFSTLRLAIASTTLPLATTTPLSEHVCGTTIYVPVQTPSIQAALDVACVGDTVNIATGTYFENIVVPRTGLTLSAVSGTVPSDVVIDGSRGAGRHVVSTAYSFSIDGMTLQGAYQGIVSPGGAGLAIDTHSAVLPTSYANVIAKNLIVKNNVYGVHITNLVNGNVTLTRNLVVNNTSLGIVMNPTATPVLNFINNTIANNGGIGIFDNGGSSVKILKNNIIANNGIGVYKYCYSTGLSLQYNDVWNNLNGNYLNLGCNTPTFPPGVSDISLDPKFISSTDYHLQSTSPAINAGDPSSQYNDPNGTRNDMGAYPTNVVPVITITPPPTSTPATTTTSTKFSIGSRVQTTANLNVRDIPSTSGQILGTQASSSLGTVIAGPSSADGFNWWNINYNIGVDGWSVENYLIASSTATSTTPNP